MSERRRALKQAPTTGGCQWCPPSGRRPPSTHVGLLDGRMVLNGCHWHMRLWVARGELRAILAPVVKPRRRAIAVRRLDSRRPIP